MKKEFKNRPPTYEYKYSEQEFKQLLGINLDEMVISLGHNYGPTEIVITTSGNE